MPPSVRVTKAAATIARLGHLGMAVLFLIGAGAHYSASAEARSDSDVVLPVGESSELTEPMLPPGLIPVPEAPMAPLPVPPLPENGTENSMGMRFVPVGDVRFSVWLTRLQDFEVFAAETKLKSTAWRTPGYQQGPDHPVVNVTWNDAVAFCHWLTKRDKAAGLLEENEAYRLPTDQEWSTAVGLDAEKGDTPEARDLAVPDVYPWGTQWPPPPGVGNYTGEETGADVRLLGYDDQYSWTSPVGAFPANRLGLYDMGGNVWQWCTDSWNKDSGTKVLRGGSWHKSALKLGLLSSCRIHARPDSSAEYYGFRVVRAEAKDAPNKRTSRRKH